MTPKEATDCMGNPIQKGDIVCVHFLRPPLGTIAHIEHGGLLTPRQEVTPTVIRIVLDLNIVSPPGIAFSSIIKVVGPQNQALLEALADKMPRG